MSSVSKGSFSSISAMEIGAMVGLRVTGEKSFSGVASDPSSETSVMVAEGEAESYSA